MASPLASDVGCVFECVRVPGREGRGVKGSSSIAALLVVILRNECIVDVHGISLCYIVLIICAKLEPREEVWLCRLSG